MQHSHASQPWLCPTNSALNTPADKRIGQLQTQIAEAEKRLAVYHNRIGSGYSATDVCNIYDLQDQIDDLQDQIDELQDQIDELQDSIDDLEWQLLDCDATSDRYVPIHDNTYMPIAQSDCMHCHDNSCGSDPCLDW